MTPADIMPAGTLAKAAGVPLRVARYYLSEGLVDADQPVESVRWLVRLRRARFSLAQARLLLPGFLRQRDANAAELEAAIRRHIDAVDGEISRLMDLRTEQVGLLRDVRRSLATSTVAD